MVVVWSVVGERPNYRTYSAQNAPTSIVTGFFVRAEKHQKHLVHAAEAVQMITGHKNPSCIKFLAPAPKEGGLTPGGSSPAARARAE